MAGEVEGYEAVLRGEGWGGEDVPELRGAGGVAVEEEQSRFVVFEGRVG